LNYCRRVLEYGVTLNDARLRVIGLWRMGAAYIYQGNPEPGLQCCNEALALGALPFDAAMAKGIRGYGEIKSGRVDAGIADITESVAWLESARLRYTHAHYALRLAEGYLRRGDHAMARPLIENVLETARKTGYLHFEGLSCWLMAECLMPAASACAEPYVETATNILERIGARNDLAKAMVTRAALRHRVGDIAAARQLLEAANVIFHTLGTHGEFGRIDAALAGLGGA
jgi:hypothetical protein